MDFNQHSIDGVTSSRISLKAPERLDLVPKNGLVCRNSCVVGKRETPRGASGLRKRNHARKQAPCTLGSLEPLRLPVHGHENVSGHGFRACPERVPTRERVEWVPKSPARSAFLAAAGRLWGPRRAASARWGNGAEALAPQRLASFPYQTTARRPRGPEPGASCLLHP